MSYTHDLVTGTAPVRWSSDYSGDYDDRQYIPGLLLPEYIPFTTWMIVDKMFNF